MTFNTGSLVDPLDGRYPDDIVADAIDTLQARRPDWVPRNASPEVVFLEAMAVAAGDVIDTGDAVIGGLAEGLLATLYGVPRLPGTVATGQITLTFDTTVSTTVPAGTRFLLADYDTEVVTTADVAVSSSTTAVLAVSTSAPTSSVNGVSLTTVDLLDGIPNALSASITGAFSGGSDPESDDAYIARAGQRLARVTNSLVVAEHFSAYVLESGLASNALTIPAWNGAAIGTAGTDAGHVTVCCYGFGGQVGSTDRTNLATAMQAITAAGVTVHVNQVTVTTVPVTVTVKAMPGYAPADVQAGVTAVVQAYLNPETWVIGDDVIKNALQDRISTSEYVDYVVSLSAPSADTVIAADAVAQYGTITVSVT